VSVKSEYPFIQINKSSVQAVDSTYSPDAHVETSSVDGSTSEVSSGSWTTLITAAGDSHDDDDAGNYFGYASGTGTDNWTTLGRPMFLFDTSDIPDDATITSANFSIYCYQKANTFTQRPTYNLYSCAPASATDLVNGDFDSADNTTALSDAIAYDSISATGYNEWALNASGLALISKTATTNITVLTNFDATGVAPTFEASKYSRLYINYAENITNPPLLEITYTEAGGGANSLTVGVLDLTSTFESISVSANFSGDSNNDSTATVHYRKTSGGDWLTAITPVYYNNNCASVAEKAFYTSLLWLDEDTEYSVNVTFTDADGVVGTNPLTGTVTTHDSTPAEGATLVYVATDGDDSTGNGTIGNPYLTIQKGCDEAGPGETVVIRAGTYYEYVDLTTTGNSTDWMTVRAYTGENVTMSGNSTLTTVPLFLGESVEFIKLYDINFENSYIGSNVSTAARRRGVVNFKDSNDILVQGCDFTNCINWSDRTYGALSFVATETTGSFDNYNSFVDNCTVQVSGVGDIGLWGVSTDLTGSITFSRHLHTAVVRGCTINSSDFSLYDGIGGYPEEISDNGFLWGKNRDFYNNNISGTTDDFIQCEGRSENIRIWGNVLHNSGSMAGIPAFDVNGIAVAPILVGPAYIFRNSVWLYQDDEYGSAAKVGKNSYGQQFWWNNTLYSYNYYNNGIGESDDGLGGITSRNNIIFAARYLFESSADTSNLTNSHSFDYDLIFSDNNSGRFIKWYGVDTIRSLALWQLWGQETHGYYSATVGFTDNSTGDLTLTSGATEVIDKGVVLPYINDSNSPWPYEGAAPDIGYDEYNSGNYTAPEIELIVASLISYTTARISANVTDAGGTTGNVTLVWGDDDAGTTFGNWDDNSAPDSPAQPQGEGVCYVDLTGLTNNTLYYYSAFITTVNGTDWPAASGNFTTLTVLIPTVTTIAATDIEDGYANIGGTLDDTGGEDGSMWGVEWGTVTTVYTDNFTVSESVGIGTYITGVATFDPNTTYFYRFFVENSAGIGYGAELSFLTLPAAPTNVAASDGTSTANVTITFTASTGGADDYYVLRDGVLLGATGNTTSYTDVTAAASVITAGTTSASDSTSLTTITVTLAGHSVANGVSANYTVKANNATGNSTVSAANVGYRGHGALTIQLQRSAADADAAYGNIVGATSTPYADIIGTANTGRYYKWILNATGALQVTSTTDRGVTSSVPATTEDVGTTIIKYILTAVIAIMAILVIIAVPNPTAWIFAVLTAAVAIVFINSAL
jgi:hypothetical protein